MPDLFLFIYDYIKNRFGNQLNVITVVGTTRNYSSNDHLQPANLIKSTNSLDGTSCGSRGKENPCQNTAILQHTKVTESQSMTNDEIKRVLAEILCWKNNADESIYKLQGMMNKEILSRSSDRIGIIERSDCKKIH